ncbi:hypothetical protein [Halobacillus andaensis]|uniref:hypothetical protein n=1 Tax=Halobacillus andaensis TaxID=1176239 RepID=UPI003D752FE4
MIKKAKYVRNAKITDQSLGSIKLIRSTTIKAARVVSSNELSVHNLKHLNTINLSPLDEKQLEELSRSTHQLAEENYKLINNVNRSRNRDYIKELEEYKKQRDVFAKP